MEDEIKDVDLLFNKNSYYRSIDFKNRKAKVKVFMHFHDLIDALSETNYQKIIKQIRKIRFCLYGYAGSLYNDSLPWGKDLFNKYNLDYDKLNKKLYPMTQTEDIPIKTLINQTIKDVDTVDSKAKKYFKSIKNTKITSDDIIKNYSLLYQKGSAYKYIIQDVNPYGINVDSLERLAKLAKTCVNDPKQDLFDHWINIDPKGKEQFLIGKCTDIPVEFLTIYDTRDYSNIYIFTINNENYFIGFNTRNVK